MRHVTRAFALCLMLSTPLVAQDDPDLELTASTTVVVVDAQGRAVPGASVWVGLYLYEVEQLGPDRFQVRTLPGQDPIPLGASAPGYLSLGREVAPGGQVTLTLDPGCGLRGRLLAPDGHAFPAGSVVELAGPQVPSRLAVPLDAEGQFETFGLLDELSGVGLRVAGFAPVWLDDLALARDRVRDLGRIELPQGRSLTVELHDDLDAPVAGWVELRWPHMGNTVFSWTAQADAAGRLVLPGLPHPPLAYVAWADSQRFAIHGVIPAGDDASSSLLLHRRVRVHAKPRWLGRGVAPWVVEGQPGARVSATLTVLDAGGVARKVEGQVGEGQLLWEGFPAGTWTIQRLEVHGQPVRLERETLEVEPPPAGGQALDLGTLRLAPG